MMHECSLLSSKIHEKIEKIRHIYSLVPKTMYFRALNCSQTNRKEVTQLLQPTSNLLPNTTTAAW